MNWANILFTFMMKLFLVLVVFHCFLYTFILADGIPPGCDRIKVVHHKLCLEKEKNMAKIDELGKIGKQCLNCGSKILESLEAKNPDHKKEMMDHREKCSNSFEKNKCDDDKISNDCMPSEKLMSILTEVKDGDIQAMCDECFKCVDEKLKAANINTK
ncbi:uncharacterized protein LOC141852256 [Brevipalpus obovatus]|uniref:uncharacterized protein LOC141852256 n=1 Tax=Brevipalpus obovatus TaxID=246614 RepID=UPI003D9DC9D4